MTRARPNRRKQPKQSTLRMPKLPRLNINWRALSILATLACMLGVALVSGRDLVNLPLDNLELEGSFQRVSRLDLEAALRPMRGRDLLTLDFDEMTTRVRAIDWVDTVQLQRVWPDTVRVRVTEHTAAARWGEAGLLNTRGELFAEDAEHEYPSLPRLAGPDGSLNRVARRYLQIRERLAESGLNLVAIEMDARGSFSVEFDGALTVVLGRDDIDARIDRFFRISLPQLAGRISEAKYIDMRYSNGFAVGWYEADSNSERLAGLDNRG